MRFRRTCIMVNTTDFDSVDIGSIPITPACHLFFHFIEYRYRRKSISIFFVKFLVHNNII